VTALSPPRKKSKFFFKLFPINVIKKFTDKNIHISTHTRPCCTWIRRSLTLSSTCWTCGKKQTSLKHSVNKEVIPQGAQNVVYFYYMQMLLKRSTENLKPLLQKRNNENKYRHRHTLKTRAKYSHTIKANLREKKRGRKPNFIMSSLNRLSLLNSDTERHIPSI